MNLWKRALRWPGALFVALCVAALAVAGTTTTLGPTSALAAGVFNVKTFGATGNGSTNDTPAINRAIAAANAAGGGTVEFPAGSYLSSNSIHMMSNVTLQLDAGSTVLGSGAATYDAAEPNPFSAFQDFGHSHFHDAMIWGDRLTNIGFVGSGTIDGAGHLITGNPGSGQADKIISLTRCDGLTVSGITLARGGHFAMLINGCNHVTSDHLTINTGSNRDGWNVISTQNATITNLTDTSNDDALVFKSDYALGAIMPNGNVTVTNATLHAGCCNALMFGSETCGDFTNYQFSHINITGAGKSGLGLVSSDGANISNVNYSDITMSGHINSLIMEKVWDRHRCGVNRGPGSISDVHYTNITGSTSSNSFAPTMWGFDNASHGISNVTFNNVNLTIPGGASGSCTDPNALPSNTSDYNPNSIGCRPAFGMFMHNVHGVSFSGSSFHTMASDPRPALDDITGSSISVDQVTATRSSGAQDVHFNGTTGYCVTNSVDTSGAPLRVTTVNSTQTCTTSNDFSVAVTPSTQSVSAGATATYTVNTGIVSGAPDAITLSVSGLPAGANATFGTNPVTPGSPSTLTVTTTSGTTPAGTFPLTISGKDSFGTHTAGTSLTVTGGGGNNNFSLSVAPQSASVAAGASATYTVNVGVASGTPDAVTLSATGLPAGATASFGTNPVPVPGSSMLTVATTSATPAGTYVLTVSGTDSFATNTATTTLVVTSGGTLTLSNLSVADTTNAHNWSFQSNLRVGITEYGDRTYTFTRVPAPLAGAQWIRTANASKSATANPLVTFTISQQATVYLAVDTRAGKRPWMGATWADTHTAITDSTGVTFEVFSKSFPAGQVALGPEASAAGSTSNYTIVVV